MQSRSSSEAWPLQPTWMDSSSEEHNAFRTPFGTRHRAMAAQELRCSKNLIEEWIELSIELCELKRSEGRKT